MSDSRRDKLRVSSFGSVHWLTYWTRLLPFGLLRLGQVTVSQCLPVGPSFLGDQCSTRLCSIIGLCRQDTTHTCRPWLREWRDRSLRTHARTHTNTHSREIRPLLKVIRSVCPVYSRLSLFNFSSADYLHERVPVETFLLQFSVVLQGETKSVRSVQLQNFLQTLYLKTGFKHVCPLGQKLITS